MGIDSAATAFQPCQFHFPALVALLNNLKTVCIQHLLTVYRGLRRLAPGLLRPIVTHDTLPIGCPDGVYTIL